RAHYEINKPIVCWPSKPGEVIPAPSGGRTAPAQASPFGRRSLPQAGAQGSIGMRDGQKRSSASPMSASDGGSGRDGGEPGGKSHEEEADEAIAEAGSGLSLAEEASHQGAAEDQQGQIDEAHGL